MNSVANSFSKVWINLFHVLVVASLICSLAKNLQPGHELLKKTAYAFVLLMVVYHVFRMYQKLH